MIPRRFSPVLFGLILSGLMSLLVAGISTYRMVGLDDAFVGQWLRAWLTAWAVAFPVVLAVAPVTRRLVERMVT